MTQEKTVVVGGERVEKALEFIIQNQGLATEADNRVLVGQEFTGNYMGGEWIHRMARDIDIEGGLCGIVTQLLKSIYLC